MDEAMGQGLGFRVMGWSQGFGMEVGGGGVGLWRVQSLER